MHTEKVLVLSTANIRVETSDWLSAQAKTSTAPDLIVYDIRRLNHAKGAGVKVKREVQDMIEELQRVYGS